MKAHQPNSAATYDFAAIEAKWQAYWGERGTFRTPNPKEAGFDGSRPKFYVLDMFPYPSGAGLHVGHPVGYCATDIYARYKRMRGFNVLHPMGYDAFGLPAEQYAIETGIHPVETTRRNIENMRRQLKMFGFSYDWDRELATCDPEYFHFTQWIFLQMFKSWYNPRADQARPIDELIAELEADNLAVTESLDIAFEADAASGKAWSSLSDRQKRQVIDGQRLAYIDEVTVNWCPALGTVLANEEVTNEGRSDRGNHPVYRKPLRQWMLRITRYAERLLADLDDLAWPEAIKVMQRNWIGRSAGAEVDFPICSADPGGPVVADYDAWREARRSGGLPHRPEDFVIRVYTTRPDTLHGATYMVLAPEHPLVERITTDEHRSAVTQYVETARHKSDLDRAAETKEKTGVPTGAYAVNPVNGQEIPIWVADYVLMGYGTGAIMAVPAGDERDFEFAKAFDLDIVTVVEPTLEWGGEVARLERGQSCTERLALRVVEWSNTDAVPDERVVQVANKYLNEGGADAEWTPDELVSLYVAAPEVFVTPFTGEGVGTQSPGPGVKYKDICCLNGLSTAEAKRKVTGWLESRGLGRGAVNYKLRDWIFSRQKYWGEPFPVLHGEDGSVVPLDESELPLTLPAMSDFKPEPAGDDAATMPRPPLSRATEWMNVQRDGRKYTRDANTMPQWAGSCWYYLRFISPRDHERLCDAEAEKYWMPVDLYVGGAEHAVLHLLYARFWHKVLYDLGHVSTPEPFMKLVNQGMVQAIAYRDPAGRILNEEAVELVEAGRFMTKEGQQPVEQISAKMSKSLKNTVSPDEIIAQYGADAFRMYEMYMGPIESSKPWNTRDVPGLLKLLQRIWRLVVDESTGALSAALVKEPPDVQANRLLHKTIKGITEDIEQLKFNTAIAQMFEFVNAMTPRDRRPREVIEPFILLVAPFAPHIAEELWQRMGHSETLAYEPWPAFNPQLAKDEEVEIAVQIKGKVRSRIKVPADADEAAHERAAMADEKIQKETAGKTIRKIIVVKGRLVNIVAS